MKAYSNAKVNYPKWYLAYARAMASQFPDLSVADRIQELYKRLSWVATAVDIVSVIGSGADASIKRMDGEEEEDVENHEFEMRLLDPNPTQSGRSFIFSLLADYKLHNKAFIWMNIVNNKPVELWRIPPTMIAPQSDGRLGISHFTYDPGYGIGKMNLPVKEIVYFSGYDPNNLVYPESALSSISLVSQSDMTMQKWNQHVYDGNGRLPGVLTFADMISDPLWENIQDDMSEAAMKQNMLLLRGTGTGSIGYIQTSSPPKDMEFYTGRQNNRDEIWNRIAPGLVSAISENSTEANSRTGKATLIDLVVYPLLQMLYETMTAQIVWRYYGREYKIEPDDIRVTDRVLELSEKQEHSKVITVDEYRAIWGDDEYHDKTVGKMLVAEAQTYKSVAPKAPVGFDGKPALPFGKKPDDKKPSTETSNEERDVQAQEEQVAEKADVKDPRPIILELEKWERKAIKSIGKEYEFECYNTPIELQKSIKADLEGCANPAAIKAVFDNAREEVTRNGGIKIELPLNYSDAGLKALAEAINNAALVVNG